MGSLKYASLAALLLASCSHIQGVFGQKGFPQLSMEVCSAVAQRDGIIAMAQPPYTSEVIFVQGQTGATVKYSFGDVTENKIISIVDNGCNGSLNSAQVCDVSTGVCEIYRDFESLLPLYSSIVEKTHAVLSSEPSDLESTAELYKNALGFPTFHPFEGSMSVKHGPFELMRQTNVRNDGSVVDRTYLTKKGETAIIFRDNGVLGDLDMVRFCLGENETKCYEPSIEAALPLYMQTKAALEDKRAYNDEFLELFDELIGKD